MSLINTLQKLTTTRQSLLSRSAIQNISIFQPAQSKHQTTQIRERSNRSKRGLYDGRDIRAGNNVPFSLKKTKRTFKPNVFKKRLYSEILDQMIPFHVTTGALRSIDKFGGLDGYLLDSGMVEPGDNEGWMAKQRILQKMRVFENKGLDVLEGVVFRNEIGDVKESEEKVGVESVAV